MSLRAFTLTDLAISATGPVGAAYSVINESPFLNRVFYKGVPDPRPAPAPSAPKTGQELQTWSPKQQIKSDQANYASWRKTAMDDYPVAAPDDSLLIVAAGVALISLYLSFRR